MRLSSLLLIVPASIFAALPGLTSPQKCIFHNPMIRPMERRFECRVNRSPEGVVKSITDLESNSLYVVGSDGWSWGGLSGGRFGKWFIERSLGVMVYFD